MANYFENLVNGKFNEDIAYAALTMLSQALAWENLSSLNYTASNEAEDSATEDLYWKMSMEADHRASGIIDAYRVLTQRELLCARWNIREEIDWIACEFGLDDFTPDPDILPF